MILERRYRRLLRVYPKAYRERRADEMTGTYLETAAPGRTRPGLADGWDVVRGAARERLRSGGLAVLAQALPVAAVLALVFGGALALVYLRFFEVDPLGLQLPPRAPDGTALKAPFYGIGVAVWGAWLVACAMAALLPGRAARVGVLGATVVTVATVPATAIAIATHTTVEFWTVRPPILALLPAAALGLVALGWPRHPSVTARVAVVAAPVLAYAADRYLHWGDFSGYGIRIRMAAAVLLLLAALVVAGVLALRSDRRAPWTLPWLLAPALLLVLEPVTVKVTGGLGPLFLGLIAAVMVLAPLGLAYVLAGRVRRDYGRS
jgi:hypothetical protein